MNQIMNLLKMMGLMGLLMLAIAVQTILVYFAQHPEDKEIILQGLLGR